MSSTGGATDGSARTSKASASQQDGGLMNRGEFFAGGLKLGLTALVNSLYLSGRNNQQQDTIPFHPLGPQTDWFPRCCSTDINMPSNDVFDTDGGVAGAYSGMYYRHLIVA